MIFLLLVKGWIIKGNDYLQLGYSGLSSTATVLILGDRGCIYEKRNTYSL